MSKSVLFNFSTTMTDDNAVRCSNKMCNALIQFIRDNTPAGFTVSTYTQPDPNNTAGQNYSITLTKDGYELKIDANWADNQYSDFHYVTLTAFTYSSSGGYMQLSTFTYAASYLAGIPSTAMVGAAILYQYLSSDGTLAFKLNLPSASEQFTNIICSAYNFTVDTNGNTFTGLYRIVGGQGVNSSYSSIYSVSEDDTKCGVDNTGKISTSDILIRIGELYIGKLNSTYALGKALKIAAEYTDGVNSYVASDTYKLIKY